MIISRTPLRMSFVGGGTDLPAFYEEYGGMVLSAAIDKYVYVNVNPSFDKNSLRIAYSKVEIAETFDAVEHPLVRGAGSLTDLVSGLEITSIADIPSSGSGLGSSSSFSVGLLNALYHFKGNPQTKQSLAELACQLEIEICNQPIGKQDQFAASFGGFNVFEFQCSGNVVVDRLNISEKVRNDIARNMMVFYTGTTRSASKILSEQSKNSKNRDKIEVLKKMAALVPIFKDYLLTGNIKGCSEILNENWQLKRGLADGIATQDIDYLYEIAIKNGALGGKLLGAGGSGFLMFLVEPENQNQVEKALAPLRRIYWGFDYSGTSIICS